MKKSNFKMTSVIFGQLVAGCLAASQSFAFVAPEEPAGVEFKHATVRPQTYRPLNSFFSRDGVHREYDKHSNAIRYLSGSKILGVQVTGTAKAAYEKVALETIVAHKPIFGVEASEVRVNQKATLVSGQDASVSFQVLRGGIRIVDAGITFHFKNGSLILVKSESYSEATPQLGSGADTVAIAAGAVGGGIPIARGSLFRVQATDAGYSLVRVNEYLVSDGSEAYIVQVDASSGAIFELRTKNLHLRGTAAAKVYPRYFGDVMVSTRLPFVNLDLATSHSSASGEFSSANSTEAPSLNGFAGKFATVKNQAADDLKATAVKANGIWELNIAVETNIETPWENQDMAQAMVYLNTTKMVSTAKNFINPDWFDTSLVANVNHAEHCNAYWDGETINFFTGGEYKGKTCAKYR
ncbi:MAG: hypothetical protein NTV34_07780 [Proteobacteria bacterium]|nr:hypothetical protein [Pseudomonadota bacterium]